MKFPKIPIEFFDFFNTIDTPAIVYNDKLLQHTINMIKEDTKNIPNLEICFSLKANRNNDITSYIANQGLGADIASLEEFNIAKNKKFKSIYATSPYFGIEEVKQLYENDITFDFNSISQLKSCIKIVENKDIGLRIKIPLQKTAPEIYGNNSRFGVLGNESALIQLIKKHNLNVKQIHIHIGEKDYNSTKEIIKHIKYLLKHFDIYQNVLIINLGGGYTQLYLKETELTQFWNLIKEFSIYLNKKQPTKIIIEPGMLISFLSGCLFTSVRASDYQINDTKNVTLDCSAFNLFSWFKPKLIYTSSNLDKKIHNIHGNTCYEHDTFSEKITTNELNVEDKIVFNPVGSYVSSMKRTLHGLPFPTEYFYQNEELFKDGEIIWSLKK
ncbi:hypothetical protein CN613_18885 [Bacillus pseudomycoides]|uniref:Orn/DAP/Arg decarboxylase 2 N-terminal domain-containing protein n=1 Tax=Bacillus pseudomycoides TaxID=64104 RepID=A0A2A8C2U4_9BACI|nr:hypothetical protein [Bacillus pseudomycoides]PEM67392.1 hypothetical protein CN613_18885 [Bacillus pseudomycoides]